jgi:predicted Zn-dependent peptidase
MQLFNQKLDNGLEVVAEVNPQAFSMAMGVFVQTGARHESTEVAGVSHFLEHMVFKGTSRRTAAEVNAELDDIGSHSNAYTCEDQTVYHATILPEYQAACTDLLIDMMRPALRPADFDLERQVILEEIAMYDDQPPYGAMERAMEAFFGQHPLSHRVLGTVDSIKGLQVEQMRAYHAARYVPNNMVVVAAGQVDFPALVDQVQRLTRDWDALPLPPQTDRFEPGANHIELVHPPAVQQYTMKLSPGVSRRDPKRYVQRLLGCMLGDESGSRLFWELVDPGIAESAAVYSQEFEDAGVIGSFLICDPADSRQVWEQMEHCLALANTHPLTTQELRQAVNKICSSVVLAAERPANRLFSVGNAWTLRGRYETVDQVVEGYRQVRLDQVQTAWLDYLQQPSVTVTVGPE